jgi:hypothetical protein
VNNSILIQCIKKIINSSRYLNIKKKTHISPDHDVDEDSNTYEQFYVDEDLCTKICVLAVLQGISCLCILGLNFYVHVCHSRGVLPACWACKVFSRFKD